MPQDVASDLGLHCLPMTLLRVPGKNELTVNNADAELIALLGWMDDLPFYILFNSISQIQSYQDDRWVIMKGCVQQNPVYGWKYFHLKRVSNPRQ